MARARKEAAEAAQDDVDRDPLFIAAVARSMRVLEIFAAYPEGLGLTDIAQHTGLGKSAAQRFIHTWERLGYLVRDERTRRFRLAPKSIELGYAYLRGDPFVMRVAPHLAALRDRCGVAVNLSLREDADMLYLLRLPSHQLNLHELLPGRRLPAIANSAGRILLTDCDDDTLRGMLRRHPPIAYTPKTTTRVDELLAQIAQAREQGYAIAVNQVHMNQIGVAVKATGSDGRRVAISLATTLDDYPPKRVEKELVPELFKTVVALVT